MISKSILVTAIAAVLGVSGSVFAASTGSSTSTGVSGSSTVQSRDMEKNTVTQPRSPGRSGSAASREGGRTPGHSEDAASRTGEPPGLAKQHPDTEVNETRSTTGVAPESVAPGTKSGSTGGTLGGSTSGSVSGSGSGSAGGSQTGTAGASAGGR